MTVECLHIYQHQFATGNTICCLMPQPALFTYWSLAQGAQRGEKEPAGTIYMSHDSVMCWLGRRHYQHKNEYSETHPYFQDYVQHEISLWRCQIIGFMWFCCKSKPGFMGEKPGLLFVWYMLQTYQWQCVNNGNTAVLHQAINTMFVYEHQTYWDTLLRINSFR